MMQFKLWLSIFCLFFVSAQISVNGDDANSPARLLVEKRVLNKYLVENKDIIINYNIFNVGQSSALNVQVTDASFSPAYFDLVNAILKFSIPRVAPSSNVSHSVVVRPKEGVWGRFNFTSAEFSYTSEGSSDKQIGFSSDPGEGYIASVKEFDRLFSPHYYDWGAFLLISLATVLFPYLLWSKSKNKYEALSGKKSK